MVQNAVIVRVKNTLMAEVVRSEACQSCRACQFGKKEKLRIPVKQGEFREGDQVLVEMSSKHLAHASILGYGVPVAGLVAGLIAGAAVFKNDFAVAALGIAGTAVGFALVKIYDRFADKSGRLSYTVRLADGETTQGCGAPMD